MSESGKSTQTRRSSQIWFDDGNIILEAEGTLFRLHRSLLSMNSSVFKDMFEISQPDDTEALDGCPLIHLSDSVDDISHILQAIYDRKYFSAKDSQPFSRIAGILRMSTKYMIHHLREEAIAYLTHDFPSTLSDWDNHLEKIDFAYNEELQVVTLVRQCSVPVILPAAFALVALTFQPSEIFALEDATLSHNDKCTWALGRETILDRQSEDVLSYLIEPAGSFPEFDSCSDPTNCNETRVNALRTIARDPSRLGILYNWETFRMDSGMSGLLCDVCRNACSRMHEARRQAFWDDLPSIFNLPSWQELRETAI